MDRRTNETVLPLLLPGGECDKRKEGRTALSTLATDHISPTQFSGSFLMSHAHICIHMHMQQIRMTKKEWEQKYLRGC